MVNGSQGTDVPRQGREGKEDAWHSRTGIKKRPLMLRKKMINEKGNFLGGLGEGGKKKNRHED